MKISISAISLLTLINISTTDGFKVNSPDPVNKILDDDVRTRCPAETPPIKNQILQTTEDCTVDYWARSDIHTLGNMGIGGAVHAAMAPFATKLIDVKAYGGVDVRALISQELRAKVNKTQARVIDLCSGVGMSTRALEKAFHDAEYIVGIDTSSEMINMAQGISRHELELNRAFGKHLQGLSMLVSNGLKSLKAAFDEETNPCPSAGKCQATYRVSNAEKTSYPSSMFDLVTIMYGFHEIPEVGRARIVNEARRILCPGGHLAILDICPTYAPSEHMLAGEPFVKEYQRNIDSQLFNFQGFRAKKRVVVAGHSPANADPHASLLFSPKLITKASLSIDYMDIMLNVM
eukprot:scaffold5312_cov71-Cyclotella_meneghiniana.AAC.2